MTVEVRICSWSATTVRRSATKPWDTLYVPSGPILMNPVATSLSLLSGSSGRGASL